MFYRRLETATHSYSTCALKQSHTHILWAWAPWKSHTLRDSTGTLNQSRGEKKRRQMKRKAKRLICFGVALRCSSPRNCCLLSCSFIEGITLKICMFCPHKCSIPLNLLCVWILFQSASSHSCFRFFRTLRTSAKRKTGPKPTHLPDPARGGRKD